jgi:serralysin
VFGSKALFGGQDAAGNYGLWVTDGTASGTSELSVSGTSPSFGLSPSDITVFGSKALFDGHDAAGNYGLWVTDGTASGTSELSSGSPSDITTALALPPVIAVNGATTTTDEVSVQPFAGFTISDPNNQPGVSETITITVGGGDANGTLSGNSKLTETSTPGVYTLTDTLGNLAADVQGLSFTPTAHQVAQGQSVTTAFTLSVTQDSLGTSSTSNTATTSVTVTPASTPGLAVFDTTTGQQVVAVAQTYTGPVAGLQEQYINITSDNLNISASTPNWFIHSGSGADAIAVNSGTNVLDGGTGSNFLTGGTGTDTFFVDDRSATADIWSTVVGFHSGDAATIWGVTPQDFGLNWVDGQGAAGYTGLTLHATESGKPTASLTLAGYSTADLNNGRLSVSFGTVGGSTYMYVHANS